MRHLSLALLMIFAAGSVALAQGVTVEQLREQYPPNEEALDPGFHWAPEFSRETVTPQRARVPLGTDWPAVEGLNASPVTFGVPFADEALQSAENARLITADGTPVPADLRTTATWWSKDGPVRWMLVSATLERGQDYFIEYGTEVEAFEAEGMTVEETADAIVISTGPMQATISKTVPTLLDRVIVNGETVVTPEAAAANLPMVVGGDGTEYPASADGMKVSFFRNGPRETVVRREGWYRSAAGRDYCQFITYTWFFADSASVRHDHTLVVAFDTTQNTIRDIRLSLPLNDEVTSAGIATDQGEVSAVDALPARLVQTTSTVCTLTDGAGATVEGGRSGGFAGAAAADGSGAWLAIRDFWEQFPAELEVTGSALVAHLWPLHDTPVLDFTPSVVMGDDYPGDRVFYQDFYRGGLDSWTQGYGIGKTHNLLLSFTSETSDAQANAAAFDTPVLAFAEPEYATDTWAFGRMHHEDREQFPQIEALVDAFIHRKEWLRERLGNFGGIDFGGVNNFLSNTGDPENISRSHWRRWGSMFHGGPTTFPQLYMRSGRRDLWDFHRVNTKHITDIDIAHLTCGDEYDFRFPKYKGGRFGGNGGVCQYGAGIYPVGCDHHSRFMLWDYYLNGTPRTWEVFEYYVDHHAELRNAGYNLVYRHRMTGGPLRFFSEAYEATWDPEYLSIAHQFADILYKAQAELGTTRYDDIYMNEGKVFYYQLTGEERMRDLFLNDMRVLTQRRDSDVFTDTRGTTMWGLTHAYWFTGDESFLPYALWQLEIAKTRIPTEGEPGEIGAIAWTEEYPYSSTVFNQLPAMVEALTMIDEDKLPPAAGPNIVTSGPIHLNQPEDGELSATVKVLPYGRVPGVGAVPFSNWRTWAAALPPDERPALVMTAPDGSEAARFDLLGEREQGRAAYISAQGAAGEIRFTLPADGQTGTYTLAPVGEVPLHLTLMQTEAAGAVIETGEFWISGVSSNFLVPAGTGTFAVDVRSPALRTNVRVTVADTTGEVVAEKEWNVGSEARQTWERLELDAGQPAQDEGWTLKFLAPTATHLRFEGVPGQIATDPNMLFVPERTVAPPTVPVPEGDAPGRVDSPLTGGGEALALPPNVGISLASPDGTPLLNETEGTIEMWLRDGRQPSEVTNRTFIGCGQLNLYRRINVGTYLYIGPAGYQTGMVLPAGRWVHLAATWRPSPKEAGNTEVALFIDGVRVETTFNAHIVPEADWAGAELTIPAAPQGLYMDELRVSDIARYEGNFDRPETPLQPDANTVILSNFDDSTALVRGTTVEWQTK